MSKYKNLVIILSIVFLISMSFVSAGKPTYCNPNLPGGQNCVAKVTTTTTGENITNNYYNNYTNITYITTNATVNSTQFSNDNPINLNENWLSTKIQGFSGWFHNLTSHITYIIDSNDKICIGSACLNNPFYKVTIEGGLNVTGMVILDNVAMANVMTGNFEVYNNLTAKVVNASYFYGKPIMGMLGSGLISSTEGTGTKVKDINVTCSGLTCTYNSFEMRITAGDVSTPAKYCIIPNGTLTVPDNTNNMYYIDSSCSVQRTTYDTWFTTTIGNGGAWDFANILTHSGSSEIIDTISLEERRLLKARVLNYYEWQGKVLEGFNFQVAGWSSFNITKGKTIYGMDVVDVNQHNVSASDTIELVGHNSSTTWQYSDQNGLNVTTCDTGTGLALCTGSNYRRHFIFVVGYDSTGSESEIHQLYPLASKDYSTISQCLDTTANPLTYTLPQEYQGSTVMLYAYCSRRTDTTWTTANLIDLRTVKTGSASSGTDISGLVPYSGATANVNLNGFNLTASGVIATDVRVSNNIINNNASRGMTITSSGCIVIGDLNYVSEC